MNNNEIAAACLIEAAELLNERIGFRDCGNPERRIESMERREKLEAEKARENIKAPISKEEADDRLDALERLAAEQSKTKNESISDLLVEAAYLLNEGAAKDQRKEITKKIKDEVKKEKLDVKLQLFYSGKLNKEEAVKIYKTNKKALEDMLQKAKDMPSDTDGEKLEIFAKSLIPNTLGIAFGVFYLLKINPMRALAFVASNSSLMILKTIGFTINEGKETTYNKVATLKIINTAITRLEETYTKYYEYDKKNKNI